MLLRSSQSTKRVRLWGVPDSRMKWLWLLCGIGIYGGVLGGYLYVKYTQPVTNLAQEPLRSFGFVTLVLILFAASYSLRRRLLRALPGKVQSWLWMHIGLGTTTLLVALMHSDFAGITHAFLVQWSDLLRAYAGPGALLALFVLVLSGVLGKLLDMFYTGRIVREAGTNGVGIAPTVEERVQELTEAVERLCAGKSEAFKSFCRLALRGQRDAERTVAVAPVEHQDFQRVREILRKRASLLSSLRRMRHAERLMRRWRCVHVVLSLLAFAVILYHCCMQILVILHVI